ncbi:HTH domain-containing protein [Lactobacillus crispatus]|uniref:HTH domain-containing protein n=2 Tax=Lactobacillus crispatus TaxID=47770 RepID=UPI0003C4FD23|nr:HTH domain-containing protein [Lactobacillus crispatus]EST03168.1 Transcriptional regulator [Lactobacillus crispatus EM-LC1]
MISERQRSIIKLLRLTDFSVSSLAHKLNVSERTINREIKVINSLLGSIAQITNNGICHLNVHSSLKLFQFLGQGVPNRIKFLYILLLHNNLSLDDVADKLYISKAKIREYINLENDELKNIVSIKIKQGTGLILQSDKFTRIDLLANLLLNYPEILEKSPSIFYDLASQYIDVAEKYISRDEIIQQKIACSLLSLSKNEITDYCEYKLDLLNKALSQKEHFQNYLIRLFVNNGFEIPNEKLMGMMISHIIREVIYPNLMLKNKSDLENYLKQQPVAFDMAKKISLQLMKNLSNVYVNAYYLALYIMLVLSSNDTSIYKIILVSRRRSISSINKYIIEDQIKGSSVYIVHDMKDFDQISGKFAIVLDSELVEDKTFPVETADLVISSLITSTDIKNLLKILRRKTFDQLVINMKKNRNFPIDNFSTDFFDALNSFLITLQNLGMITGIEKNDLINREKAGNQLIINDVSLPHMISSTKKGFHLYQATLSTPVTVDGQFISKIIVVIIGINVASKSEIFKYLYEFISKGA